MRFRNLILFTALTAVCSFTAAAADAPLDFTKIRQQQIEIREDVLANEAPYDDMSQRERSQLVERQGKFLELIEGKETALGLDESGRTEAINSLEWISATIRDAEENRLVCTREKRVGTNMATRVCRTVAELRRERESAERAWQKGSACGTACMGR